MEKIKKENLVKELKEHISMLIEFDRFEMASYYCEIAKKVFYDKPIEKEILVYMADDRIEIDNHIKEYLKSNNLIKGNK